jgi:hypothetical protein
MELEEDRFIAGFISRYKKNEKRLTMIDISIGKQLNREICYFYTIASS